ncbi:hypothetical protein EGW08_018705 [Elysia chlorotica]|uniref:Integrase catalytic domain-containing protein n=1 Tax=Elysia chlorotica TaxID=188477 RepID=A0A3S0ZRE5_ELYCH|nr:hypothetical protein EGW08_018705 [Elysia chlorotica]
MEALGVIDKVHIPTDWVNSVAFSRKQNGNLRICLDPKDMNRAIKRTCNNRSLSLIIRDAEDDGSKALKILRNHYKPQGKPRVISLYTQLTSLVKGETETITDYVIRAETAATALRDANEEIRDSLLFAMVLKGLPESFKPFTTVITQSEKALNFIDFKSKLRNFEDTENAASNLQSSSVMFARASPHWPQAQSQHQTQGAKHQPQGTKNYKKHHNRWCTNCRSNTHDTNFCRKKTAWCSHCKSNTHNTRECRKLNSAKSVQNFQPPDDNNHYSFKVDGDSTHTTEDADTFLVDSGASVHIVKDKDKFIRFQADFNPANHFVELADGSRSNNLAKGQGDVIVCLTDTNGQRHGVTLKNALYVPSFKTNIFSVRAAVENGASVTFNQHSTILNAGDVDFKIKKKEKMYFLNSVRKISAKTLKEWHNILGHCNVQDILKLSKVVDGLNISDPDRSIKFDCEVCTLGKMPQNINRTPDAKAESKFDLVHIDLAGPIDPVSKDGYRYALVCVDDFSGLTNIYFLKNKSDSPDAFRKYLADITPYGTVKCVRSDQGGEFTSKEFRSVLLHNKIKHEMSAPFSPHQNGTAERAWRTTFDMARCLILQSGVPKTLWHYAVSAASFTRNRCYNKRLNLTPFEVVTHKKPNLKDMQPFGKPCYGYVQKPKKLEDRAEKGIFIGMDRDSPAHLVYFPESDKVKKIRVVKFFQENSVQIQNEQNETVIIHDSASDEEDFVSPKEKQGVPQSPETETGETNKRVRAKPKYLEDYVTNVELDERVNVALHYCYGMNVPKTFDDAMNCEDSEKWKKAMDVEMSALRENDTYELTTLPPGKDIVGGKWVFAVKDNQNDEPIFKARFVAKGYSQTQDIDYGETFSPTAHMSSLRALMQISVQNNMIINQMDVKSAYLNAPIDYEIYVKQPEGYEVMGENCEKLVLK